MSERTVQGPVTPFWGGAERVSAIIHAWMLTRSDGPWRIHHEVPAQGSDGGRIDIWALRVSWSRLEAWAFECKVSRSDFRRDVDAGKWRKYLSTCNRFYWVVPEGLVTKDEVPKGTGLVYVGGGVKVVARPEIREWKPSWKHFASILFSLETPFNIEPRTFFSRRLECRVEPRGQAAQGVQLQKWMEREKQRRDRKKDVVDYEEALKGKAELLKNAEQTKADLYKLQRKLSIVNHHLGVYNTPGEDELEKLMGQRAALPRARRHLEQLAADLGCKVVDAPA